MTARRDPDRILEAWLDLMPSEVPDRAIDAVLRAVETAPQVRRRGLGGVWRSPTMTRLILILAAALVGAALLGAALLGGGGRPNLESRSASPSPAAQATESPLVSGPGLGRGMGYATTAPAQLAGASWVAELPAIPGITDTPQVGKLSVSAGGTTALLERTDGGIVTLGRFVSGPAEMVGVGSAIASPACPKGSYGMYQMTMAADGVHLELRSTDETCPGRATALARTWARSLTGATSGGIGFLPISSTVVSLALPDGTWNGRTGPESAEVVDTRRDRTLFVVHDPVGVLEPCTDGGGGTRAQPTDKDRFLAYLGSLPGFTVQTESITLGGQPAARVTIPTAKTADCPSGKVMEWRTRDSNGPGGWFISQGDTDVLYLLERPDGLWLLQWLGNGVTRDEEISVLDTVAFTSSLTDPLP